MKVYILIASMVLSLSALGALPLPDTKDGYILKNEAIATNTVSITSIPVTLGKQSKVSVHSVLASGGAATGTVAIYLSNDMVGSPRSIVNWVQYSSTAITAAGQLLANITDIGAKWLKVVFTKSTNNAATGSISSIIHVQ